MKPTICPHLSFIPNTAGFKLTMYRADGSTVPAVVAKDADGLHVLNDLAGAYLPLKGFIGWETRTA